MADILSNIINDKVNVELYNFNAEHVIKTALSLDSVDLGVLPQAHTPFIKHRQRNQQTSDLLERLRKSLRPTCHNEWLNNRGINPVEAKLVDHSLLSKQDLLDLYIYPDDYILDEFGEKPVEGPAFLDIRNGKIAGVLVRNLSKDKDYAAATKFTCSNFGWFLYGFDLYDAESEVFIVEGVFDALAMRKSGFNAIALGAAYPSAFQIGCLQSKFNNLKLCLDNDFWGRNAAYIVSKVTKWPIFLTNYKDPAEHPGKIELYNIDLNDLKRRIDNDMVIYNRQIIDGTKMQRPLPYNH
ncbi:toprim domain-containing protein [bacterium]|nr:toprim domain-containing protein [bacterium]